MLVQAKDQAAREAATQGSRHHEFLVVCQDSVIFKDIAAAVRQVNGRLNCAGKVSSAADYIARRKVDGIVIDMGLPGALELIQRVRNGSANRGSVVFACIGAAPEAQFAIRAGANFLLQRPLAAEKIAHIFNVAASLMVTERRRNFRYPLMVPVELTMGSRQVESTMSNLSEAGMAIWSLYFHTPGSRIHFAFEIPFGGVIRGHGEVAWTNADGLAGVKFDILPDRAYTFLSQWIAQRDGMRAM
ncbi:MAG TPA: PilZ domain-containing protein [Candidatus Angelobacter sp.]|nr:PilZ domain-containing protein [Candidatus Angelobacter sp.]